MASSEAVKEKEEERRVQVLEDHVYLPEMTPMPTDFIAVLGREPEAKYYAPGLYSPTGAKLAGVQEKNSKARMVIEFAGVTFIWAVFGEELQPGEEAWLTFHNVDGTAPITSFFSEWDREGCVPKLGDALLPLLSSQRGRNVARVVGRNDGDKPVLAAAGFIFAQDLDLPA